MTRVNNVYSVLEYFARGVPGGRIKEKEKQEEEEERRRSRKTGGGFTK